MSNCLWGKSISTLLQGENEITRTAFMFPLLKWIDWFPWEANFQGFQWYTDRNLDSDWLALKISTIMKCRLIYRALVSVPVFLNYSRPTFCLSQTKTWSIKLVTNWKCLNKGWFYYRFFLFVSRLFLLPPVLYPPNKQGDGLSSCVLGRWAGYRGEARLREGQRLRGKYSSVM